MKYVIVIINYYFFSLIQVIYLRENKNLIFSSKLCKSCKFSYCLLLPRIYI